MAHNHFYLCFSPFRYIGIALMPSAIYRKLTYNARYYTSTNSSLTYALSPPSTRTLSRSSPRAGAPTAELPSHFSRKSIRMCPQRFSSTCLVHLISVEHPLLESLPFVSSLSRHLHYPLPVLITFIIFPPSLLFVRVVNRVLKYVHVLRLDEMEEGAEIQSYLAQKTGQRTVPNIFVSE